MALFGRDYDRDYGYYGGNRYRGNDMGYRGNDMGYRGNMYGTYDRDYGYYGTTGYDRNYKSRWETDFGDPFGDREAGTPMRVIRGEYHPNMYDRDVRATGMYDRGFRANRMYDRDYYEANPATYDPYMSRRGTWARNDNNFRSSGYGRGYDRGWF